MPEAIDDPSQELLESMGATALGADRARPNEDEQQMQQSDHRLLTGTMRSHQHSANTPHTQLQGQQQQQLQLYRDSHQSNSRLAGLEATARELQEQNRQLREQLSATRPTTGSTPTSNGRPLFYNTWPRGIGYCRPLK